MNQKDGREDSNVHRRNVKRPRLMAPPDGFRVCSHKPQVSIKNPVINFTSVFSDEQSRHSPSRKPTSPIKSVLPFRPPLQDRFIQTPNTLNVRALGRPNFAVLPHKNRDQASTKSSEKRVASLYQPIVNSPQSDIPEKLLPLLRIPPPITPSASSRNTGPLKVQLPPALLVPKFQSRELKTISTTRVARATDPSTEDGNTELLSIFLQDDGHALLDFDQDLQRGILSSPETDGRGKSLKFIRNGLAERAYRLLSRSQTVLSLWQLETENLVRSSRRLTPDMRLRIIRVLRVPCDADRSSSPGQFGLVLCHILTEQTPVAKSEKNTTAILVLSGSLPSEVGVGSAARLERNGEILLWRPWYEVDIPIDLQVAISASSDHRDSVQPEWDSRGISALLCSRFLVI